MRTALFLAAVTVAATATAQIPLPSFGSTFTSTLTRGFWFQAPTGFVIQGIRVPNEAAQAFQVVEIINLGAAAPPAYPGTVTGTQLFYNNTTAAGNIIPCNVPISPGMFVGILGACTATVGNTTSYNSYASVAGPFASTILGNPVTLTRFGTQSGISSNGGNQPCWQEVAGQLSRVEVFVGTGSGSFANASPYGTGCYSRSSSFYENFGAASAFDLSNSSLSMIYNSSNGYVVLPGISTFVTPPGTATTIANGDDVDQAVTLGSTLNFPGGSTTSLTVCSNGFISAASNGTSYTPSGSAFLAFTNACWAPGWHDLNPSQAGSGPIQFHEAGSVSYVTWNGVWDFAGSSAANACTMQVQFDRASGNVHMIWQTMSTLGSGFLTGYKPGGTVVDPGNRDISVTLPGTFNLGPDILPLALATSARPIVNTSINLLTTNVPANSGLGATILSFTQFNPGLDLTSLGMPGCRQYVNLDASLVFIPAAGTGTVGLNIPNNQNLSGLHVFSQSAAFSSGVNTLGVLSSNGMDLTIGLQ